MAQWDIWIRPRVWACGNIRPGRLQYWTCPALRTPPYPANHREAYPRQKFFLGNFFLLNNMYGLVTSWPHLRVQEAGNTQLSLSQAEGQAVVGEDVGRVEALIVQEVRTEVMDDGAECEAVPEGSWQVLNPHIVVVRHNPPSPDLNKRFSCWLKLTNLPWELWDLGPPQETSFLTECQHGISCCAVSGQQSWNSANSNILCSIHKFECCFCLMKVFFFNFKMFFFNLICLYRLQNMKLQT